MIHSPLPVRRAAAVLAAFLVALVGAGALAGPASAHGGPGKLVVVSTEPQADGTSVKVTVQLNFAEDGDPAADATVTVVGELDGGGAAPEFTPVTLTASGPEGQYAGVVPIPGPGTWNLRVTSVEPPATATTQVSTAATTRTADSVAPSTTAAAASTTTTVATADAKNDSNDDGGWNPVITAGIVGGVVGGLAAWQVGSRRKKAAAAAEGGRAPSDDVS